MLGFLLAPPDLEKYAAAAKSLQSCPTLCDPIDGGPPGSPVPGILQARTLEWVVMSFSNARKGKVKGKSLSRVRLFMTPWSAAYQAPPSMGFSRQEYWSGVPLPSPWRSISRYFFYLFIFWPYPGACRILIPWPGIEPVPLHWKHRVLTTGPPGKSLEKHR